MPDDLSGFVVEFRVHLRYGDRIDMSRDEMCTIMLRGVEGRVLMYSDITLDKEDCDLYTRKRLWCSLFGHKDLNFLDAGWMARCHCQGLAIYSAEYGFVHLGRCRRCNTPYLPRARIFER